MDIHSSAHFPCSRNLSRFNVFTLHLRVGSLISLRLYLNLLVSSLYFKILASGLRVGSPSPVHVPRLLVHLLPLISYLTFHDLIHHRGF
jgi:hypothetical protein